MRCEGYVKENRPFALGGVSSEWIQCPKEAKFLVTVKQDKLEELPCCSDCLQKSKNFNVYISHKSIVNK